MKTVSTQLQALLDTRQFYVAKLYTFTLVGGTVQRYTDGDRDIKFGGNTYLTGSDTVPLMNVGDGGVAATWKTGTEVDSVNFGIAPGGATIGGVAFITAVRLGVFDGAELQIDQAFMPTYGDTSVGVLNIFSGRVAEMDVGRTLVTVNANSHLELLNQNWPKNLFQPGCTNTLYDASCTLLKSSFSTNGTAAALSTSQTVYTTSLSAAATGYYNLGTIMFTSGALAGFSRSVKAFVAGGTQTILPLAPFPSAPAAGDAFTIYPGCDKKQATCSAKFSNLANFRGYPYVPESTTAV